MRSRAARVISSVLACVALGAAAFYVVSGEQQLEQRRAAVHAFDLHAREASQLLSDARAGLHAYMAAGQAVSFWGPKVGSLIQESSAVIDTMRPLAATSAAREALLDVSASVTELASIDKRARDYLASSDSLMAGDVVFSDGSQTAADAAHAIESTRLTEHQEFEKTERETRQREAVVLGGTAVFSAIVLLLLAVSPAPRLDVAASADASAEPVTADRSLQLREAETSALTQTASVTAAPVAVVATDGDTLKATAALCTSFGQLREAGELKALLARASDLVDATGLVVWIGSTAGADLQPVAAHGYADDVLKRIRAVPRNADNAAAAAYRSGTLQVVPATANRARGAIVAPILAANGCIGAVTAETRDGAEGSPSSQALVGIVAAQLAGVLGGVVAQADAPDARAVASA